MARYNTIFGGPSTVRAPQVEEARANVALTPGHIVILSSGNFILHNVAGGRGPVRVVQENYLANKTPDDVIAQNNTAMGIIPMPDQILRVLVANGQNVAKGAKLQSNGSGLCIIAAASDEVLFYAEEAFNNNTGSAQLVQVRPAFETTPA